MELASKYVYKIYQQKNFSAAAKALYISQPALSAAVARLERELGFRIFDRTTVPLSLTPQGRVYIDTLEEIMESENNMRHRLRRLSDASYGTLSVGGSSYTDYYFLPTVCGVFHRRYPEVDVRLDMGNIGNIGNLAQELQKQTLDVLFSYAYDPHTQTAIPLFVERMVIAMHRSMPEAAALSHLAVTREELLDNTFAPKKEVEDVSLFSHVPFLRFGKNSNTYGYMAELLGEYETADCCIENARHSGMHYHMMCAGLGAVLTSTSAVAVSAFPATELLFFVLKNKKSYRTLYAVQKKGVTPAPIVLKFLEVAKEVGDMGMRALSLYV